MKQNKIRSAALFMTLAILLLSVPAFGQSDWGGPAGNGPGEFIDENGDGFNDLAPDHDGDGIPNALDEDWVRPQDGTGAGNGPAAGGNGNGSGNAGNGQGNGYGPGDGTGNGTGNGPGDGTGNGPGDGSGDCPEVAPRMSQLKVAKTR